MIQRIQTLFLTLAIISSILMFFYPVESITEFTEVQNQTLETDYYHLNVMGIGDPSPDTIPQMNPLVYVPVLIALLMVLILSAYAILRFRNRLHQLKLVKTAIFINILLIAGIFLNYPKLFSNGKIGTEMSTGAWFPLISLVFLVLANRYILKDEKLVKSVDRLR